MPAIAPRVLVTDERQRPMASIDIHCVDRATGAVLAQATTDIKGVALFSSLDDSKDFWFRPMGSRNQSRDGSYGHLRVTPLKTSDSDTLPPAAMMDEDKADNAVKPYIVVTTPPREIAKDTPTDTMTVQRRDADDNPLTDGALVVYLYSSSATGVFKNLAAAVITSITIADGNSTASFTYTDSVAGTHVIKGSLEVLT